MKCTPKGKIKPTIQTYNYWNLLTKPVEDLEIVNSIEAEIESRNEVGGTESDTRKVKKLHASGNGI